MIFIEKLYTQLSKLNLNILSQESNSEDDINPNEILDIEANLNFSNLNKITYERICEKVSHIGHSENYYPRPTPRDILYEEAYFNDQVSYQAKTIYTWNIDAKSTISLSLHARRCSCIASVCKAHGNTDADVCRFISHGFVGILKGWWDNVLTHEQRDEIYNSTKVEFSSEANQNISISDAVYTLCLTIVHHFIGPEGLSAEKNREMLQNLRCPTLSHFRWYKDVFLAKVLQLHDANSEHWKSKFIDGLPNFFAEKVRKKLRDLNGGSNISYESHTYGSLISQVIQEGLSLCNDLKLQHQLKKQNLSGKQELGEFCEQFAYDIPSQRKKKISSRKTQKNKDPYYSTSENEAPCQCNMLQSKCDSMRAILQMNGLAINVLTSEQQSVLELIDSITDLDTKLKLIKTCFKTVKDNIVDPTEGYNLKEHTEQPLKDSESFQDTANVEFIDILEDNLGLLNWDHSQESVGISNSINKGETLESEYFSTYASSSHNFSRESKSTGIAHITEGTHSIHPSLHIFLPATFWQYFGPEDMFLIDELLEMGFIKSITISTEVSLEAGTNDRTFLPSPLVQAIENTMIKWRGTIYCEFITACPEYTEDETYPAVFLVRIHKQRPFDDISRVISLSESKEKFHIITAEDRIREMAEIRAIGLHQIKWFIKSNSAQKYPKFTFLSESDRFIILTESLDNSNRTKFFEQFNRISSLALSPTAMEILKLIDEEGPYEYLNHLGNLSSESELEDVDNDILIQVL
ncbi:hypothetical protein IFM89_024785 [Coptis chinensis]|uniref:DUF7746 domain-containing protein n=1 Tax=Coptis chinensis TaxID=261450 RepID=A0A835HPW5_9MAGN|nr:hypothetical protein IFM89_024785 [Coptis chinensis]